MISKEEIKKNKGFNLEILREGLRGAEQRLSDALQTKENFDKKAFQLFTVYMAFCTGLLGLHKSGLIEPSLNNPVLLCGIAFLVGIGFLLSVLNPLNYGTLGRYPNTWLEKEFLTGGNDIMGYVMANILFTYQETISTSDLSNDKKETRLRWAIYCGVAAPSMLGITSVCSFFW